MQPYLFPYAGYFNLVAQVDKFVFYDDVNFIKGGWINRNRLLLSGDVRYFTVPLSGASPNLKINQVKVQPKAAWERKLLESIRQSYAKAPHFAACFDLIKDVLDGDAESIAALARRSIIKSAERLGYDVAFVETSAIYGNAELSAADRVIDICVKEQASQYVNLPGGKDLYSHDAFARRGVALHFSRPALAAYAQFRAPFEAGLSIVDMMMFNDFETCAALIAQERDA
ncbi:WbqC family protein [Pseudomonas entomophila]|uniref:WbqC family protein n=1 Tax=Pseudomonas entomophila TaxID=312306 RepID=UPI002406D022|nr:WbqC family protein [Pseudomonas entomophila]MDF9617281.1 WbqC family protein [Pseudomonas entomophila]